jgi:DNA-binding CsgD family transcriptional regulator
MCHAETFMPLVSNYAPSRYNGDLQNWSCTQDENGKMFFGNNKGLLSFDGFTWTLTAIPGNGVVRSVMADGKRIYTGSYTDFGYFEQNIYGQYVYKSLWPKKYKSHNDEIWNILKTTNGHIYFQSFCSWFDYYKGKVTSHFDPQYMPLYFFAIRNQIYVQMMNGDFYGLLNDKLVHLISRKAYGDDNVVAALPYSTDGILLITEHSGIFLQVKGKVSQWRTQIDNDLKKYQVNRSVMLGKETIIIGTISNGIYAISTGGKSLWHYSVENRLYDNTVLRLFIDRKNNIWAALDIGISLIHTGIPITILRTENYNQSIGMVYGMSLANGNAYIGTNLSVWNYNMANGFISQVNKTDGQNWYVARFGSQIFAGNNFGTMTVNGNNAEKIPGVQSGSTSIKEYSYYGQNALIESSYSSFRVYQNKGGKWAFSNSIDGFSMPIHEFEIDNSGIIWAAHMSKGLYKIEMSKDLKKVTRWHYYPTMPGAKYSGIMHVLNIRGRVIFTDGNKLYTYDDIRKRIIEYHDLDNISHKGVISAVNVDNNTFWLADENGYSKVHFDGRKYETEVYIPNSIFGLECNTSGNPMYVSGDNAYFFMNNGIGCFNGNMEYNPSIKYVLSIAKVTNYDSDNKAHLLPCDDSQQEIKTTDNISISLSYPNYNNEKYIFKYRLEGSGTNISSQSESPNVVYNSLSYGDYKFTATIYSISGKELGHISYKFSHNRPLPLTIWAFIFYAILLFITVNIYIKWRSNKLIRKNQEKANDELMRKNLKVLEQEQIIAQQQKLLLENEIEVKGKEMASLALANVARKNSVDAIKDALREKERTGSLSRKDIDRMLSMIDSNDTDTFWSVFQNNFDLIHKNFFRNLHKRYPNLTPSDMRFCALLRLNLSTKDIARFTNLTIRGVEGARFRLRKKLDIPTNKSLTDFLIEFE